MRALDVANWNRWGLSTSLVTSLAVHGLLLTGALVGWNLARQAPSFPVDAIEIAVGEFLVSSGVKHHSSASKPVPIATPSPKVELAVDESKKKKPEPAAAASEESVNNRLGEGGEASASSGVPLTERERYLVRIRERLHEALVYPRASRNLGETGRVKVKLSVLRDGTITDIGIAEPSAFERLNSAAMDTVKRVAHLDPLPGSYPTNRLTALVPIDFQLH